MLAWWVPPRDLASSNQVHAAGVAIGVVVGLAASAPRSNPLARRSFGVGTAIVAAAATALVAVSVASEDHRPVTRFATEARNRGCATDVAAWIVREKRQSIEFFNGSAVRVDVYRLDPVGFRDFLITLYPGDRVEELSWVGERWIVTRDRGGCLAVVRVEDRPTTLRIGRSAGATSGDA